MPFCLSSWRTYYHPAAKRRADGKSCPRSSCTTLTTIHERAKKKNHFFLLLFSGRPIQRRRRHHLLLPPFFPSPFSDPPFSSLFPHLGELLAPTTPPKQGEEGRKEGKRRICCFCVVISLLPYPGFLSWRRQRGGRAGSLPSPSHAPSPPNSKWWRWRQHHHHRRYLTFQNLVPSLCCCCNSLSKKVLLFPTALLLRPGECCFCLDGERERGGEEKDWMGGSPSSPSWIFLEEEGRDAIAPLLLQKRFFWS